MMNTAKIQKSTITVRKGRSETTNVAKEWRTEAGPQYGIPVDVAPLTGIRLTNSYFDDRTVTGT